MEAELGQAEDELVQAESAVSRTLPRILGHEGDRTFGVLEDNELYFQIDSESDRLDPDAEWEDEVSPEVIRYQEKLDEVDALKVQLMEMANDRRRLWYRDDNDLRAIEISFLEAYATRRNRVKKQLHTARSELEWVRNLLQPAPLLEDEPPQPSDPLQSHDTARAPLVNIQQVEHWLDDTQGSTRQGGYLYSDSRKPVQRAKQPSMFEEAVHPWTASPMSTYGMTDVTAKPHVPTKGV